MYHPYTAHCPCPGCVCNTDVPRDTPARVRVLDVLSATEGRPRNGAHVDVRPRDVHSATGTLDRTAGLRIRHVSSTFIMFVYILQCASLDTTCVTAFRTFLVSIHIIDVTFSSSTHVPIVPIGRHQFLVYHGQVEPLCFEPRIAY